MRKDRQIYS
jgi:hypothetical protein